MWQHDRLYTQALDRFAYMPQIKKGTGENTCLQKLRDLDWLSRRINAEQDKSDDPEHAPEELFAHKEPHLRRSAVFEAFNQLNDYPRIEFRKPVLEVFEGEPVRQRIDVPDRFTLQRALYELKALAVGEVPHKCEEAEKLFRF